MEGILLRSVQPIDTDPTVFAEIPVREEEGEDTPCLVKVEVEAVINRLKKSKSLGVDNVTAEEIEAVVERAIDVLPMRRDLGK